MPPPEACLAYDFCLCRLQAQEAACPEVGCSACTTRLVHDCNQPLDTPCLLFHGCNIALYYERVTHTRCAVRSVTCHALFHPCLLRLNLCVAHPLAHVVSCQNTASAQHMPCHLQSMQCDAVTPQSTLTAVRARHGIMLDHSRTVDSSNVHVTHNPTQPGMACSNKLVQTL